MAVNRQVLPSVPLLRAVQINLNKSQDALHELYVNASSKHWDVLLIQEPHWIPNSKTLVGLKDFRVLCAAQKSRAVIAVNNSNLSVFLHQELSDEDLCVATISSPTDSIVFVSAYHKGKPRHNLPSNAVNIEKLSAIIASFPNKRICFGVDANAYSSLWGSEDEDNRGQALADFIAYEGLIVLNDGEVPTYCHQGTLAKSFIDVTFVSHNLSPLINDWRVSTELNLSDHRYILFDITLSRAPTNVKTHAKRFNLRKANWDLFRQLLEAFKPTFRLAVESAHSPEGVERVSALYMDQISVAAHRAIPLSRPFSGSKGWWDQNLTDLRREARRLRNRLKGRPTDFVQRKALYLEAYHRYRQALRKTQFEAFKQFCTVDADDPWGSLYNMLKPKCQRYAPLKPLLKADGTLTSSEPETVSLLLEKYFPHDDPQNDTSHEALVRAEALIPPNTSDDLSFSETEVRSSIWRMKPRKAPGYDLITAPILRKIADVLLPEITLWFNKCLSIGCFPSPFKRAVIKFIPKPNSEAINTPKAFRPICLLPSVGKSLDSLLIKRIEWFLNTTGRLSPNQYGFTPQRGTVDAILGVTELAQSYRRRGWCVLLCSIDNESAFDSAKWHYILAALRKRGCPSNLYRLAQHYFCDRFVRAETESCSVTREATQGCMQGSPSGPIFWNIVFDDINSLDMPEHVFLREFADDTFVIACGGSVKVAVERANKALALISEWGRSLSLKFNASKTQILCIGRGSELLPERRPPVFMDGQQIHFSETIKYLGVIIDHQLSWTPHIRDACRRTHLALSRFAHMSRRDWGIGPKALKSIWTHALEPALTYASAVWAGGAAVLHNKAKLRTVQRAALLRICRAYRTVSHEALHVLSGVRPIDLRVEELATHYYVSRRCLPDQFQYWPVFTNRVNFAGLNERVPYFSLPHPAARSFAHLPSDSTITEAREAISVALVELWQADWETDKERITYKFFPLISARLQSNFTPNQVITQYLTDHGDLRAYLARFTLRRSPECHRCALPDTSEHRLIHCPLYNHLRAVFSASVNASPGSASDFASILLDSVKCRHFKTFVEAVSLAATAAGVCAHD